MATKLRSATSADIPAIAQVGSAAFDPATDAIVRRLFPAHLQPGGVLADDTQAKWLTRRVVRALDNSRATVLVAEDVAAADVVGCAVWIAPHHEDEADDALQSQSPPPPRVLPPNMDGAAIQELMGVLSRQAEVVFGPGGSENAWELDFLAVDPGHQRKGIGKMLLGWGTERAKVESRDCYVVATATGKPLYSVGGLEEVGQLEILGVPHWQMLIRNDPRWSAGS